MGVSLDSDVYKSLNALEKVRDPAYLKWVDENTSEESLRESAPLLREDVVRIAAALAQNDLGVAMGIAMTNVEMELDLYSSFEDELRERAAQYDGLTK